MILVWLIAILLAAGVLACATARSNPQATRWIALAATSADFVIGLVIWVRHYRHLSVVPQNNWIEQVDWSWVPRFGVHFHLALDGLSLLLVLLTFFLGMISVLVSWTELQEHVGFFHLNLLWVLAGITGVFLALDLFLFYFAWELMLVPMYFLIALWGHERRQYASVKFFLFTQFSGLLMLIAILALYFAHHQATGVYTFEYQQLLATPLSSSAAWWMMLGFFIAFAVKLPVVPLHTWLPDAHTEAPTAGSVVLAGLLLKTGGYGLLRFVVPLFPSAAHRFAPIAMILAVIGILYGGLLALGQSDFKRLVAYTSISHLGFVLLGVFAWNELALDGAVVTMIAHGISTGALFVIAGLLQQRMHTREMGRMGGLWSVMPRLSGAALFFALASLGLPGLGDFVGESLVLLGTYPVSRVLTVWAAIGILVATFYALNLLQRTFYGPNVHDWRLPDLGKREALIMIPMIVTLLCLGLYPAPVLNTFKPAMSNLRQSVDQSILAARR
jgi:NADH-quinone oxidoreductase subunit M